MLYIEKYFNEESTLTVRIRKKDGATFTTFIAAEDEEFIRKTYNSLHVTVNRGNKHYARGWVKACQKHVGFHIAIAMHHYPKEFTKLIRLGKKPVVDHINGNPLDNRWCNLRVTTAKGNAENRRDPSLPPGNSEGTTAIRIDFIDGKFFKLYAHDLYLKHYPDDSLATPLIIFQVAVMFLQGKSEIEAREWIIKRGFTPECFITNGFPADKLDEIIKEAKRTIRWGPSESTV